MTRWEGLAKKNALRLFWKTDLFRLEPLRLRAKSVWSTLSKLWLSRYALFFLKTHRRHWLKAYSGCKSIRTPHLRYFCRLSRFNCTRMVRQRSVLPLQSVAWERPGYTGFAEKRTDVICVVFSGLSLSRLFCALYKKTTTLLIQKPPLQYKSAKYPWLGCDLMELVRAIY